MNDPVSFYELFTHSLLRAIASKSQLVTEQIIKDTMSFELKSLSDEREQSLMFNGEQYVE